MIFNELNLGSPNFIDMKNLGKNREQMVEHRTQLKPLIYDANIFGDAAAEFVNKFRVNDISNEEIRLHVSLFDDRIDFYQLTYGKIYMGRNNIILRSLLEGPAFNDVYSTWWKRARFDWANVENIEPVEFEESKLQFSNFNSIYPPFFLMFFVEEPDDYKWMMGSVKEPDPDRLFDLEEMASNLSENYLSVLPKPEESLIYTPVSSNGFDGIDGCQPEWSLEYENPAGDYEENRLVFMRGFAHKRPTESRDIGTLTPQSMRLHRRIMYPMQIACRRLDSVYGRDLAYLKNRVRFIGENSNYFYMRDYTKSGMTIPHPVVKAILSGFYRRWPKLKDQYIKAFMNAVIYLKNDTGGADAFHPTTGFPLGMFVEGFTILSYCVHWILLEENEFKDFIFDANNDDVIVGHLHKDAIVSYGEADLRIQHELSMSVKQSKTGISTERFFYCEEYYGEEGILSKDVLYALSIIGSKYAINVVHAKELVYSILMASQYASPALINAVKVVAQSFNPEFSTDEYRWPYIFGGWWPQYKDGLESSILWRTGDCIADAAYWACQERIRKHRELKVNPTLSIGRNYDLMLAELPTKEHELISLIPLFGSKKTLKSYYGLLSRSAREMLDKYRTLYVKRQKRFWGILKGREDCPSVTYGWLRRHPNSVVTLGMDGVKYTRDGGLVKPIIGLKAKSFDGFISSMIQQGYIIGRIKEKLSRSECKVHSQGVIREYGLEYYPCSNNGASASVISMNIMGVNDFYERHHMCIESIDNEDTILQQSHHWHHMPIPLTWIIRICNIINELDGLSDLGVDTYQFWIREVGAYHMDYDPSLDDDPFVSETQQTIDDYAQFEDYVKNVLDSIKIDTFKATLVPLRARLGPDDPILSEGAGNCAPGFIRIAEGSFVDLSAIPEPDFWDKSDESEGDYGVLEGF